MNLSDDLNKKVSNTVKSRRLFNKSNYLMLMVSGGSDSVALTYIINELVGNSRFAIMHLNHNLRKSADHDAKFVKDLAWHLDVDYFGYSENIKDLAKNKNVEAVGHDIRYKLANEACQTWSKESEIPIDKIFICTAHNADDRIENFYMRSIVGTGPGGFAGINYKNNNVIRPLLDIPKEELIKYIEGHPNKFQDENKNYWCTDETNNDTDRFRAYVRHNIIPLAKRQNPKMIENLTNSMNLISAESDYLETLVSNVIDKYIEFDDLSFSIKPEFKTEDLVLKRRAIYNALIKVFPQGTRIETKSITSILQATEQSNYTDNIQENYSVHSNKNGVLVQPMDAYRKSRNRL